MSIIEDEFGFALRDPVRRKSNNTKNLRSSASKVSRGVPEVMVKITGFGRGASHVKAHFSYITRHGDVELENENGQVFKGKEEVKEVFDEWAQEFKESKRRVNQRDTMHLVLSMPENVDSVSVHQAVREFTKRTFSHNYQYVFALHTDEPHPHCHVTVKMLGFDGKRLDPRKDDLQAWRDGFAEAMQLQGVEASATPRRSRGVVRKAENSVVRHIERGDEFRAPRMPRVKAQLINEVVAELIAAPGSAPPLRPWENSIKERQQAIRSAWLNAAAVIDQPKSPIVFKKELRNEQPKYEQLDAGSIRRGQLSAGVYQSGLKNARPQKQAATIASLRNMSGLDLVQSQRSTQMLLYANARSDLGHDGRRDNGAGDGLRRPGNGTAGVGRANGVRNGRDLNESASLSLSAQIRGFVASLPPTETLREATRRQLEQQFRVSRQLPLPAGQPTLLQPLIEPSVVPSKPKDRDLER